MSRPAILAAITSLPHEITGDRAVIFLDPSKPGHNALNQLASALECAMQSAALRDEFAGKALGGMMSDPALTLEEMETVRLAYRLADLMLQVRSE
jgi:hypothetical protein